MRDDTNPEELIDDGTNRRALLRTLGAGAMTAGLATATGASADSESLIQARQTLGSAEIRRNVQAIQQSDRAIDLQNTLEEYGLGGSFQNAVSTRIKLAEDHTLASRAPAITGIPYTPSRTGSGRDAVGLLYALTAEKNGGRTVLTTLGFSAVSHPVPMRVGSTPSVDVRIHGMDGHTLKHQSVVPKAVDLPGGDEVTCTLCEVLSVVVCSLLGELGDTACEGICSGNEICRVACEAIVDFADQEFCRTPEKICTGLDLC